VHDERRDEIWNRVRVSGRTDRHKNYAAKQKSDDKRDAKVLKIVYGVRLKGFKKKMTQPGR